MKLPSAVCAYSMQLARSYRKCTHKVGTRKPNPFGIHDLYGNVWEWTLDQYDEKTYENRAKNALNDRPVNVPTADKWSHVVRAESIAFGQLVGSAPNKPVLGPRPPDNPPSNYAAQERWVKQNTRRVSIPRRRSLPSGWRPARRIMRPRPASRRRWCRAR